MTDHRGRGPLLLLEAPRPATEQVESRLGRQAGADERLVDPVAGKRIDGRSRRADLTRSRKDAVRIETGSRLIENDDAGIEIEDLRELDQFVGPAAIVTSCRAGPPRTSPR